MIERLLNTITTNTNQEIIAILNSYSAMQRISLKNMSLLRNCLEDLELVHAEENLKKRAVIIKNAGWFNVSYSLFTSEVVFE